MEASGAAIIIVAILALLGTVISGFLGFAQGRGASIAAVQASLNASFGALVTELQEERKNDRRRMLDIEGRCNGMEQHIASLEQILRDNGIEVPRRPQVHTVFVLDSQTGYDQKAS